MRVQITLDGEPGEIQAIVGLAVTEGLLVEYSMIEAGAPVRRKVIGDCPFAKDDRIMKAYQSLDSVIPRFATGTVHDIKRKQGGWSVLVAWDTQAYGETWIQASRVTICPDA